MEMRVVEAGWAQGEGGRLRSAEVFLQIDLQDCERLAPSGSGPFELIVPLGSFEKAGVHQCHTRLPRLASDRDLEPKRGPLRRLPAEHELFTGNGLDHFVRKFVAELLPDPGVDRSG